ncbi:MAG: AAA family ATPase [Microscillaceae bacterium]|nr:AAA family ATPase [Microscillaceae bacterium]
MKIRKIKIKGYKVFDDIELDFTDIQGNTLDTIVLAGVNGSGKTTILELINKLFSHHSNIIQSNSPYDDTFIKAESVEIEFDFSLSTKELILNKLLEREVTDTLVENDFKDQITLIKKFRDQELTINLIYKTLPEHNNIKVEIDDFNPFLGFTNFYPKMYYIPANTYLHEKYPLPHHINFNPSWMEPSYETDSLANLETFSNIVEYVDFRTQKLMVERFIVNFTINRILEKREKNSSEIINEVIQAVNNALKNVKINTKLIDVTTKGAIFQSFNGQKITIDDLSNGEKQLFYRAVYLQNLDMQDSIILVDEAEASLHPTWQQEILKLYQNVGKNNQIILATHSPHIIASVKPESLFVLVPEEESGKIKAVNMAKAHKNTKGLEPNRILREIMGTPLRDYETQQKINQVTENLHEENFENPEIQALINQLTEDLGRQDPFIMKVNHQITLFKRKKTQPTKL